MLIKSENELRRAVEKAVDNVQLTDVHTHLFTPDFGNMLLWGIDELLTYHYLIAETMLHTDVPYSEFWDMPKREQANLVWDTLFIKNSPYSEACRGVLTVLSRLGLDVGGRNLEEYRKFFENLKVEEYIDIVFKKAGVKEIVMTNDPFDSDEVKVWQKGFERDKRFLAALRIDKLLNSWEEACLDLKSRGYDVTNEINSSTQKEIRRFLSEWIDRMNALYMAVSLPPSFRFPENSARSEIIRECILPVSREKNVPFAMMIGVKRGINPELKHAGDGLGKSGIEAVEHLCAAYPKNKFMVTMLSRENQHELCVTARKFRNLLVFGCWWFLNNPSLIEEMTRMRFELLGTRIIAQNSDCRVLDQLIYKWGHSRKIVAKVLIDKYSDILDTGWFIEENEIARDVEKIFGQNFHDFLACSL